jgi:hypothetical protein
MTLIRRILIAGFLLFCLGSYVVGVVSAEDCGCNSEPDGGWGAPDYTDDPSWGSSFDDLSGGGGSSTDTDSGSGSSGGVDDSSSGDTSGGGGSSSDSSSGASSDSGSSSSTVGGSAEQGTVWRIKADDLALEGLYNESLAAYEKSITYDPYTIRSWMGKGKVLLSLERFPEAADAFGRVLRLDPGNTDALILLGDAQNASGNFDEAISSYSKALAMNPNLEGIQEKISLTEIAKTMVSTTNSSGEAEVAIVANMEANTTDNTTMGNDTVEISNSETAAVPATHSAAFPGITSLLFVCGMGLLLMYIRRK